MSDSATLDTLSIFIDPVVLRTYLGTTLLRRPCDHSFHHTQTVARAVGYCEIELPELLDYLNSQGAMCDCQLAELLGVPLPSAA